MFMENDSQKKEWVKPVYTELNVSVETENDIMSSPDSKDLYS